MLEGAVAQRAAADSAHSTAVPSADVSDHFRCARERRTNCFFPEIDIFSEAAAGRFNVVNVQRRTDVAAGDGSK